MNLEELVLDVNYLGSQLAENGTSVVQLLPDAIPSQIGRLTRLQGLDLKDNYLGPELNFEYFAKMSNLSKFFIDMKYDINDQNAAHLTSRACRVVSCRVVFHVQLRYYFDSMHFRGIFCHPLETCHLVSLFWTCPTTTSWALCRPKLEIWWR